MQIEKITLTNFRNFKRVEFSPSPGLNLIAAPNARGKSNLLEGIAYLTFVKSPRAASDQQLLCFGKTFFKIEASASSSKGRNLLQVVYQDNREKKVSVDGVVLSRLGDIIGLVNSVWFVPEHLNLVKGGPIGRRNYLDLLISQLYPRYRDASNKYRKSLMQRNYLLRINRSDNLLASQLDVWDNQIISAGSFILFYRLKAINQIQLLVRDINLNLTSGKEQVRLDYVASVGDVSQLQDLTEISSMFDGQLKKSRRADLNQGITTIGPHRDDLLLKINEKDARYFASQGQQRTIALSLKLAEMEIIKKECKEYPLLLLDDVLSELDQKRRAQMVELIKDKGQCFVTCTEPDLFPGIIDVADCFSVEDGTVRRN